MARIGNATIGFAAQPDWRKHGLLLIVSFAAIAWLFMASSNQHRFLEGTAFVIVALLVAAASLLGPVARVGSEIAGPLIAIVGCDGSGKSTLAGDVAGWLRSERSVTICYLGLGSGDMGERIKRWPVIGRALEAKLAKKAAQTRTKGEKIPGMLTALVVFGFSLARRRRFRRMLTLRQRGVTVITDRYPQTEVAGFYDGPGLSAAQAGGPVVAWLAARERRMYETMADFRPDLVLRLNVDVDTAFRRKPEHKLNSLRDKVAVTPMLRFNGAHIVDLDSMAPYSEMAVAARRSIRSMISAKDSAQKRAASAA